MGKSVASAFHGLVSGSLAPKGGHRPAPGAHGLLGAFGPGFSSELMLLRWN